MADAVISLTEQQAAMLTKAQAEAKAAGARYDALIRILIAGTDAPAGAAYRVNLTERAIVVSPPEPGA